MTDHLFGDDKLAMSNTDVARLTRTERTFRVSRLVAESDRILKQAIRDHITDDGKTVAAVVGLFSGGNDSTGLYFVTHYAHANTGIGIEQTREFVRNTCEEWGIPLLERTAPNEADHYRTLVLDQGFPGPGHHFKMYQRLKERALRQVQRELVTNPRRERVVFLAGRRRTESQRRADIPKAERRGSVVWVSPLVNWTRHDLNTYRLDMGDVPVNEVSDLIHMSGECLCGSFAAPGERAELTYWFPTTVADIEALEAEIADRDDIPEHRKTWGWGADPLVLAASRDKPSRTGLLCSSCDDRYQAALFEESA